MTEALPGQASGPVDSPPSNEANQTESRKRLAVEPSDDTSPVKRGAVLGHRLACKKLSDKATIPSRGSAWAAGYDLSSAEECVVPANGRKLVKTDIAIAVPAGTYGRVAPRSGLALKKGIDIGAGVIDADYRGNVGVILFNLGDEDFMICEGDRIAQLILECIITPDVAEMDELPSTQRGAGGFGSTGGSAELGGENPVCEGPA